MSAAESVAASHGRAERRGTARGSLRRSRRLTLRDDRRRGPSLSESFLSQLERGQTGATVQSLQRIAERARSRGVRPLLAPTGRSGRASIRRDDRAAVAWGKLGRKTLLTPKPFESLEVVAAEFEPGGSTGDVAVHARRLRGAVLVVAGTVELELDGEVTTLDAGDCAHYRSSTPHRVANLGPEPGGGALHDQPSELLMSEFDVELERCDASASATVAAVDDVDLQVRHGEFLSLLGPVRVRQDDDACA